MKTTKILLVEDDLISAKIMGKMIHNLGYSDPIIVSNCDEAIKETVEKKPDLIIMDINLGDDSLDGIETAQAIKKHIDLPIVFLTAHTDESILSRAISINPNDFLLKPINLNDLRASIELSLQKFNLDVINKELVRKLKETKLQLFKKEKLASIGELAAGMAHEVNTPLAFIQGNVEVLKEYSQDYQEIVEHLVGDKMSELHSHVLKSGKKLGETLEFINEDIGNLFDEVTEGVERIQFIINNLREFSNIDSFDSSVDQDLNDNINLMLNIVNSELGDDITIEKNFENLPMIRYYTQEINQALLEVMKNAIYAVKANDVTSGGKIKINTYSDDVYVYCEIHDDGCGIKTENMAQIFNPFFTTKEVGSGKGLGLSLAHYIIENKHKGSIYIDSSFGEWSKCVIKLPLDHE